MALVGKSPGERSAPKKPPPATGGPLEAPPEGPPEAPPERRIPLKAPPEAKTTLFGFNFTQEKYKKLAVQKISSTKKEQYKKCTR